MADPQTRTRDLLANERTFLAWLRTSAAVMVLGLAIAKFAGVPRSREIAAAALLVVVGVGGVFEGERRRRSVERAIEHDEPMRTGGELAAAVVLVVALLVAFVLLLV